VKAPAFAYVKPASLEEVFDLLDRYGDEARLLAGGQSLLAGLAMRLAAPRVLIDITGLGALAGMRVAQDRVTIGALTRHRTLEIAPEIARHLPLIAQAVPHIAHPAVRNRGTFGGSMAFADPAAELPACSLALGASLVIAGRSGERRVAAGEFFKGLYETDLGPGELLVAAEFPRPDAGCRSAFQELARRHGDYALVGLAAHARMAEDGLADIRLAFFGVGATPVLAQRAAQALEQARGEEAVRAAQAALADDLQPFDDVHASAVARMHLARVLLARVVAKLETDSQGNQQRC
jgi:carbon-monoxide dehydrogenase medium subunit